ncbi:MAG: kelch repeat-containing protein, partial [Candidatus Thermoplasmatota archaeon]
TEKTPQGLLFPSVVWNNKKNVLLVYGGFKERINETGELNITGISNELWEYRPNENKWYARSSPLCYLVCGRALHTAVWMGDKMAVFGGVFGEMGNSSSIYFNDLLFYDYDEDKWISSSTPLKPEPRAGHSMVFAPEKNSIIVYGGTDGKNIFDLNGNVWVYNLLSNSWVYQPTLPIGLLNKPAPRYGHTSAWMNNKMVVFGGNKTTQTVTGQETTDETWVLDFTTTPPKWEKIETAQKPSARIYPTSTSFISFFGSYIGMAGGIDPNLPRDKQVNNEFWKFDGNDWVKDRDITSYISTYNVGVYGFMQSLASDNFDKIYSFGGFAIIARGNQYFCDTGRHLFVYSDSYAYKNARFESKELKLDAKPFSISNSSRYEDVFINTSIYDPDYGYLTFYTKTNLNFQFNSTKKYIKWTGELSTNYELFSPIIYDVIVEYECFYSPGYMLNKITEEKNILYILPEIDAEFNSQEIEIYIMDNEWKKAKLNEIYNFSKPLKEFDYKVLLYSGGNDTPILNKIRFRIFTLPSNLQVYFNDEPILLCPYNTKINITSKINEYLGKYANESGDIEIIVKITPDFGNVTVENINLKYNLPPKISSYLPKEKKVKIEKGKQKNFSVECIDEDNDTLSYKWIMQYGENSMVIGDNSILLFPPEEFEKEIIDILKQDKGVELVVIVDDGYGGNATHSWSLEYGLREAKEAFAPYTIFKGLEGIVLLITILLIGVAIGTYLSKRKKKEEVKELPKEEIFKIEETFLIYNDGRLIHHATSRLKPEMDKDILSSMLTAVQTFVKDAFGGGRLDGLKIGDKNVLLEKGAFLGLACITIGKEPSGFRERMKETIMNIEISFKPVVIKWSGDISQFSGVDKHIEGLLEYKEPIIFEKKEIDIASELEFYHGYVRLKIGIKNRLEEAVTNAYIDIFYNEEALRLDKVEPAYPLKGSRVELGVISPNEKKSVAFYLDPQICTESYIDALLAYKDAKGNFHTMTMKRKRASVVCPIMYTDENINVAMLKRMISEDMVSSEKFFKIPVALKQKDAFTIAKSAVERHDIKFVREFIEKEVMEAWYFGKTKVGGEKLIIKVAVREDMVEYFVASKSTLVVTGLLAELKKDINEEIGSRRAGTIEQVIDEKILVKARGRGRLLDRYHEAEIK